MTELAFVIVQLSDSRNREADCFPGTVKYPPSTPLGHLKTSVSRTTKHVLTCSDRSQYSALHILDIYFKEDKGMGKNKVSLTQPMSKQCTSCARATLRHLAAGLDWHRGNWAIRVCAHERRQDSRSY